MKAKYDKIGTSYNTTRKADNFLTEQLLKHLNPLENGRYLDIGCGTGNYTNELSNRGFHFIGIDPSETMLAKARIKNSKIDWRIGTAENTGLSDNSIDGIIASLTIHHWTDIGNAFLELSRILKKNGRVVIFTSTPSQMSGYWLCHYFPKMLNDSIVQMPSLEATINAIEHAGITILGTENYSIKPDLMDQFLYCGKQNPKLYLEEDIRNGISSFSALANKEEVKQGLSDLKKDIDNGEVDQVIESYENQLGDYLFVIGENS